MRVFLVSLLIAFVSLTAYPQSKLAGAGKGTKVGTTTPKKSSSSQRGGKNNSSRAGNSRYESSAYMEITDVKFGNVDYDGYIIDKYGAKLYASEVKYLKPRLSYRGLSSSEKTITLNVKIIKEDGTLEQSSDSLDGYTYKQDVTVEPGDNHTILLLGWGTKVGGGYSPGLYGFEIWYKGKRIFHNDVRLYSGVTPIVQSNIFSITSVSFANTDKDGNIISDFGQPLIDGKVQYLKPKIYYRGKYSNEQQVTLYARYFKSSGGLVVGSSSPVGFSFTDEITIKPGSNSLTLSGFGNEAATNYKEGVCKVEFWLDGEKIYETNVTINKSGSSSYSGGGSSSSINDFFPLWGVTLGKTTWKEGEALGCEVKKSDSSDGRYMYWNGVAFWDHRASGVFKSIYWSHGKTDFPSSWKSMGFSWDNSYNTWVSVFKKLGYNIKVIKEPQTKYYDNRNTLSAEFEALSSDGMLKFDLDFDYGDGGYYTSSPKTLYSIRVKYLGR